MSYYGEAPKNLGRCDLPGLQEFMHYLYLPVRIPASDFYEPRHAHAAPAGVHSRWTESEERGAHWAIPPRLAFLWRPLGRVMRDVEASAPHLDDPYVYVSVHRGYASPGNPLNRPGWHCDDFGGTDLNYIWSDVYPTRLLLSDQPLAIDADDARSMEDMTDHADPQWVRSWYASEQAAELNVRIEDVPTQQLVRLTPYVIHDTPIIPSPGGMRSFIKVSVSTHRYNLLGNSHNHLLDYDWPMVDRAEVRNQPAGNKDYA